MEKIQDVFLKLKTQNGVLKRAVLEEQAKRSALEKQVNEARQQQHDVAVKLRAVLEENDALQFQVNSLTQRVRMMQEDQLQAKKLEGSGRGSKRGKAKDGGGDGGATAGLEQAVEVMREELERKVEQNRELNNRLASFEDDKREAVGVLEQKLGKLQHELRQEREEAGRKESAADRAAGELREQMDQVKEEADRQAAVHAAELAAVRADADALRAANERLRRDCDRFRLMAGGGGAGGGAVDGAGGLLRLLASEGEEEEEQEQGATAAAGPGTNNAQLNLAAWRRDIDRRRDRCVERLVAGLESLVADHRQLQKHTEQRIDQRNRGRSASMESITQNSKVLSVFPKFVDRLAAAIERTAPLLARLFRADLAVPPSAASVSVSDCESALTAVDQLGAVWAELCEAQRRALSQESLQADCLPTVKPVNGQLAQACEELEAAVAALLGETVSPCIRACLRACRDPSRLRRRHAAGLGGLLTVGQLGQLEAAVRAVCAAQQRVCARVAQKTAAENRDPFAAEPVKAVNEALVDVHSHIVDHLESVAGPLSEFAALGLPDRRQPVHGALPFAAAAAAAAAADAADQPPVSSAVLDALSQCRVHARQFFGESNSFAPLLLKRAGAAASEQTGASDARPLLQAAARKQQPAPPEPVPPVPPLAATSSSRATGGERRSYEILGVDQEPDFQVNSSDRARERGLKRFYGQRVAQLTRKMQKMDEQLVKLLATAREPCDQCTELRSAYETQIALLSEKLAAQ